MKSNSYWKKRLDKIFDDNKRKVAVKNLYRQSYGRILAEVEALYEASKERKITRTELYRFNKFLAFRNSLKKELDGIVKISNNKIEKHLRQAYKDAGLAAKERLGKKSGWTVHNRKMVEACVERSWSGKHFSKNIWNNRTTLARTVEQGIADCIVNGNSKNELLKTLNKNWSAGRRRANCLVRTELMHALNTGQIETYQSEGVKYLDFECESGACPLCLEVAAGNPYPIDKLPCIIRHPNCRCTWLPVEEKET